jgi:hypothetical protein
MSIRIALSLCFVVAACSGTKTGAPTDASPDTDGSSDTANTDTATTTASGDASFTGTLDDAGLALNAMSAIAVEGEDVCGNALCIYLTNEPNPCAMFDSLLATPGALKANLTMFILAVGPSLPVTVGSYSLDSDAGNTNTLIDAQWYAYDSTCTETQGAFSQANVTLTAVGTVFTGTFQASYGNGHSVSGSFNAPICNVHRADAPATDATTCVP